MTDTTTQPPDERESTDETNAAAESESESDTGLGGGLSSSSGSATATDTGSTTTASADSADSGEVADTDETGDGENADDAAAESDDRVSMSSGSDPGDGHAEFIADSAMLETMFDAVNAANGAHNECHMYFEPDGVQIYATDPAQVLMGSAWVPADAFESYDSDGVATGVKAGLLADFALVGDVARIGWNADTRCFEVKSGPASATVSTLPLDEVVVQKMSDEIFSRMTLEAEVPMSDISTALSVTDFNDGAIEFAADADGIVVSKETDTDSVSVELENADYVTEPDEPLTTLMGDSYMGNITSPIPNDATVTMQTADTYVISFEAEVNGVELVFLQAPRIPKS